MQQSTKMLTLIICIEIHVHEIVGRGGEGTVENTQGGEINMKYAADLTTVVSSVGLGAGHGGYGGGADHDNYNSGM
jgi:hypothetical protein